MPAYTDYPFFKQPSDSNAKVWRYMDFAKYVSLLEKGLWFPRVDRLGESFEGKLGNPFEGTISGATKERHREVLNWVAFQKREALASEEERKRFVEAHLNADLRSNRWHREWTYVNSWHMNEHESAAMWGLYTRTDEAVAIQTTYARLRDCLPSEVLMGEVCIDESPGTRIEQRGLVYLGEVRYIDPATDAIPQQGYRLPPSCSR